jgi:site-specific DNA recombinase
LPPTPSPRDTGARATSASLLAGLLFDAEGQRLTPTHAVKKGRRYRYYVSRSLITEIRGKAPEGLRLPAGDIEQIVAAEIGKLLAEPARLADALGSSIETAQQQQRMLQRASDLAARWSDLAPAQRRSILMQIVRRIEAHSERIDLQLLPTGLAALLGDDRLRTASAAAAGAEQTVVFSVPVQLRRAGTGMAMIIDGVAGSGRAAKPDPKLIKLIARAHLFRDKVIISADHLSEVARREKLSGSYFVRLVRLSTSPPTSRGRSSKAVIRAISAPTSCSAIRGCRSLGPSSAACSGSPDRALQGDDCGPWARR